jgi:alpha-L-arabinofuranosidase
VQHARTITAAIYYALANAAIAQRGRHIQIACINYLSNHGGGREAAFDEGFGFMHANALCARMYSHHFGRNLVESRASGIPTRDLKYAGLPWSKNTSEHKVPKLTCLASIDRAKRRAYLMVINTTADETLVATIAGSGKQLDTGDLDAVVRLSAASLTAVNTREEPDNISLTRQNPPGIRNGSFQWAFPPATVTSFTYRLK